MANLMTTAQWDQFRKAIGDVTDTFFTATAYLVKRTLVAGANGRPGSFTSGTPIALKCMVQEPTHQLVTKIWGPDFQVEILLTFDTRHLAQVEAASGALTFDENDRLTLTVRPGRTFRVAGGLRRDAQVNPHATEPQELLAYLPLVEVRE